MSDSRIDKMVSAEVVVGLDHLPGHESTEFTAYAAGQRLLAVIESAGLIVSDPADPAVIDRVRKVLRKSVGDFYADAVARDVLAALGGDRTEQEPNDTGPWDIGDPEPGPDVTVVVDEFGAVDDGVPVGGGDHAEWHLTNNGSGWKGYKDGGKTYLSWPELVRRWGPVRLRNAGDQR